MEESVPTPLVATTKVPVASPAPSGTPVLKVQARESGNVWSMGIGIFFLGVMISCILFAIGPTSTLYAARSFISRFIFQADFIAAEPSEQGMEWYMVRTARLSKPGFLALFTKNNLGTVSPNNLTQSRLLPAGTTRNVQVVIDRLTLSDANVQALWPGSKIFIVMFYDDGDGLFNLDTDTPAKNILGDLVYDELTTR